MKKQFGKLLIITAFAIGGCATYDDAPPPPPAPTTTDVDSVVAPPPPPPSMPSCTPDNPTAPQCATGGGATGPIVGGEN